MSDTRKTVTCAVCDRRVKVNRDGHVAQHIGRRPGKSCPGTGRKR